MLHQVFQKYFGFRPLVKADLRHSSRSWLSLLWVALFLSACASGGALKEQVSEATIHHDVSIRWTAFGIPHIRASNYSSLGYGIGYSYARDNLCLLAEAVVTVRGERSKFFGKEGQMVTPFGAFNNADSDVFHRFYLSSDALPSGVSLKPDGSQTAALLAGYAAGYNRYLRGTPAAALPEACRNALWVKEITADDLTLLLREQAIQASGLAFLQAIVDAKPSTDSADNAPFDISSSIAALASKPATLGSNAYAFGRSLTENGRGLLVGNPHFPWQGTSRFYEMHLTIPGELDVMGASLPPFPVINIGFNSDVAWSHTVSTGKRLTLYRLQLSPTNPHVYLIDGRPEPMRVVPVAIEVTAGGGKMEALQHNFYMTRYGPLIMASELGLTWDKTTAYAIRDVNQANDRLVEQWLRIDQAKNVGEIKQALAEIQGVPWVNTLAADRNGDTLYADFAATPAVSDALLVRCSADPRLQQFRGATGLFLLDGSKSACDWEVDPKLVAPGLMPAHAQPSLQRQDYVFNSNDSFWLANPAEPLTGYPAIIGSTAAPQRLRTRAGYEEIRSRSTAKLTEGGAEEMIFGNRNYAAQLSLDEFLPFCFDHAPRGGEVTSVDWLTACAALKAWDRRDNVESKGAVLFREFWRRAAVIPDLWRVGFDPASPLMTPRDLNLGQEAVQLALVNAFSEAITNLERAGLRPDASLAAIQRWKAGGQSVAIGGGEEFEGVLNELTFGPLEPDGYARIPYSGTSYVQIVSFGATEPQAAGILTYGQSSDPASPHMADQIGAYAQKRLPSLPYTEAQIRAAGILEEIHLSD